MKCPYCKKEINEDFIEYKNLRIYKWDKPVKEFKMPNGFELAEEKDFIDAYDEGLEIEQYPVIYFTKNRSKKNIENGWALSRLCLNGSLFLGSYEGYLADSSEDGLVVVRKIK